MSDTAAADPELEELIIRLGCLEVRVRGRGLQTAAEVEDSGFVVVGPTRVAPIGPEASGEDWDTLETRVLAATSPNELAGLNILELAPLARQLRASVQGWSPLARVGRAYRAGVSHRAILRGDFGRAVSSPTCPIRNTLYIALRCRSHLQGFWTSDLGAFLARVKECSGNFPASSVRAKVSATLILAWCWAAMASGTLRRPCSQEEIQELAGQITATRPFPHFAGRRRARAGPACTRCIGEGPSRWFLGSVAQRGSRRRGDARACGWRRRESCSGHGGERRLRNFSWQSTGGRAFLLGRRSLGRGLNSFSTLRIHASRIKWKHSPQPYIDSSLLRAAYADPEILRMPADCWPVTRPALVHADRSELLTLARTWDYYGALSIFGARELEGLHADEEVGLFCVNKDADYDRMIVNPTVVNGRMFGLSDASKGLSPGWLLGSLHLDSGVGLRFHAADLSDFYHSFQISHPRSFRNRVRARFKADELRGLTAFREGLEEPLAIGLRTLAKGDSLAVEVAQSAHTGLLQSLCGSMREGEVLKYREPVPRGSFIEALSIDDHICLQKLPLGALHSSPDARDATTFRSAKVAYRRVGLHQNEKKDKVVCTAGTILGAELDGVLGVVSAPRDRVHCLCVLSSYIASKGFVTGELLDALLGCWIHVLMFRRALFCLVDHLFREKPRASRTAPFQLGPHSRNELFLLSVLGGLAQSDLRASYHPELH